MQLHAYRETVLDNSIFMNYLKQDEGELLDDDPDLFSGPQSQPAELDQTIDYNFAQQELMMNEYSNDPIQEAICDLEKQYEEDKQGKEPGGCTSTSTQGESALCCRTCALAITIVNHYNKNMLKSNKKNLHPLKQTLWLK